MSGQSPQADETGRTRVLLVDDHSLVRSGLAQLINQESNLVVCGEAASANEARKLLADVRARVAIVDISLNKDLGGIELVKDLRALDPDLLVIVLSMHDEAVFAERALRAGAQGYVMKSEPPETLLRAIRDVLHGEVYLSEKAARGIVTRTVGGSRPTTGGTPVELLADRELEVFQAIGRGLGTGRIARDLHLSVKTVETYRARIKGKLQLPDAEALVEAAVQWVRSMDVS